MKFDDYREQQKATLNETFIEETLMMEALSLNQSIMYGTNPPDFNDMNIIKEDAGDILTFYRLPNSTMTLAIGLTKGSNGIYDVVFGTSLTPTDDSREYDMSPSGQHKALLVFGAVVSVVLSLVNKHNTIRNISFTAYSDNPRLNGVYDRMVSNETLMNRVRDISGFVYVGKNERTKSFIFTR